MTEIKMVDGTTEIKLVDSDTTKIKIVDNDRGENDRWHHWDKNS